MLFLYLQTVRSSVYQPFITHTLCLNPIYISFICGYMWFLWWLLQPGSVWWPGVQGSCPWPRFSHLHVEFTHRWTAEWVFLRRNRLSLCVTKEFLCDLSVSLSRWSLLIRQEQIPQCDQPFHFPSEQTHTRTHTQGDWLTLSSALFVCWTSVFMGTAATTGSSDGTEQ